ncbi:unnamed protein product [Gordionus sp. m RMFG-2023]
MRIIVLIDIDCFYVQVERLLNLNLVNKPCAVVQYNPWKGGGIIALSYEAKNAGVTRGMRGEDAKEKYRDESVKILDVIKEHCVDIERASIDEAYLDITKIVETRVNKYRTIIMNTKILNDKLLNSLFTPDDIALISEDTCIAPLKSVSNFADIKTYIDKQPDKIIEYLSLVYGAILTKQIRNSILSKCGFECSAGISQNKILAKLGCGLNKPNKQTIVAPDAIEELYKTVPLKKISGLGGKLGNSLQSKYDITYMYELTKIPLARLKEDFGNKCAEWLHDLSKGIENEPIKNRLIPKSIGCGKNFPGGLVKRDKIYHWMLQLVDELLERLGKDKIENQRSPKTLHLSLGQNIHDTSRVSHQIPFPSNYKNTEEFAQICLSNLKKFNENKSGDKWGPPITNITISANNFVPAHPKNGRNSNINTFVTAPTSPSRKKSPRAGAHVSPIPPSTSINTITESSASPSKLAKTVDNKNSKAESDLLGQNVSPTSWQEMDKEVFESLPESIKWEIRDNLDYKEMAAKKKIKQRELVDREKRGKNLYDDSPATNLRTRKSGQTLKNNKNTVKHKVKNAAGVANKSKKRIKIGERKADITKFFNLPPQSD